MVRALWRGAQTGISPRLAGSVTGDDMIATEVLHARPEPGATASACCGRTLRQLPRYDRMTVDTELVTCGRLTPADEAMLTGQPIVLDPEHEHTMYTMAATVAALSQGQIDLATAYENIYLAMRLVLPPDQPLDLWTAALMIEVTIRAQELAQR